MKKEFKIQLPKRRAWIEVDERQNAIEIKLRLDKYGEMGDENEIQNWLYSIISPYDSDPRPIVMVNNHSGERAFITQRYRVITAPDSNN